MSMTVARSTPKWGTNMTTIIRVGYGPRYMVGATIGRMFPLLWSMWPATLFTSLGMTEKRRFRRKWPLNAKNSSIDTRSMTQLSMGRVHNRHYLHFSRNSLKWNVRKIYVNDCYKLKIYNKNISNVYNSQMYSLLNKNFLNSDILLIYRKIALRKSSVNPYFKFVYKIDKYLRVICNKK